MMVPPSLCMKSINVVFYSWDHIHIGKKAIMHDRIEFQTSNIILEYRIYGAYKLCSVFTHH